MKRPRREDEEPWQLLLPWLSPLDIAAVAATCRRLHRLCAALTAARAADASRGLERRHVPFRRRHPLSPPYAAFLYSPFSLLAAAAPPLPFSRPWPDRAAAAMEPSPFAAVPAGGGAGCRCLICSPILYNDDEDDDDDDDDNNCDGEYIDDGDGGCPCGFMGRGDVITECGPGCACGPSCPQRRSQGGVAAALEIGWTPLKGWGLFASEPIQDGAFICEYAGEYLTTTEARRRQKRYDELAVPAALLVLREHLPSGRACLRVNVDATWTGNVARFINHECGGGNLAAVLVRCSGLLLPRICFFAGRDIAAGEELSFSYGETTGQQTGRPCFCGSPVCKGVLPSEQT